MPKINSRAKGASGEREFCQWLFDNFDIDVKPKRNLVQTREGGADVIFADFAFEIKRCQKLELFNWWMQIQKATQHGDALDKEPIVAFRQNGKDWEFLISAKNIGLEKGYLRINYIVFKNWFKNQLTFEKDDKYCSW